MHKVIHARAVSSPGNHAQSNRLAYIWHLQDLPPCGATAVNNREVLYRILSFSKPELNDRAK
jgi:hypothetical protein